MSLYNRGGVWHYDFALIGHRYRGSTKERVQSRARLIEAMLIARAKEQGPSLIPRRPPVLRNFAPRFFAWVDHSQLEPKSKLYYKYGWRMVQKTDLAGMRLDQITTDIAERAAFSGSPSNINRGKRTLRRMLSKAAEWGVIRTAPRIKLVKEYGRSVIIDEEIEAKLLAVAPQPLYDVILIIDDTGLRPDEIFRLRWEHVNWRTRTIFNPYGKTPNARRLVAMSERLAQALLQRMPEKPEGWVFPSKRSKSGHLTTVAKQFAKARQEAGLPKSVVLYCGRHAFGTYALEATGNLAAVMKAMGHTSAQTAMRYQHPGIDAIRRAVDARNEAARQEFAQLRHNSRHSAISAPDEIALSA